MFRNLLVTLWVVVCLPGCFAKPDFAPVAHIVPFTNGGWGLDIHTRLCSSKTPLPTADCNLDKYGYKDTSVAPKQ